jgi:hypothetical protein
VRSFTAAETRTLLRVWFMTLIFQPNVPNPEFWGERALFYRCSFYPLSGALSKKKRAKLFFTVAACIVKNSSLCGNLSQI